jgi:hypothetical protein
MKALPFVQLKKTRGAGGSLGRFGDAAHSFGLIGTAITGRAVTVLPLIKQWAIWPRYAPATAAPSQAHALGHARRRRRSALQEVPLIRRFVGFCASIYIDDQGTEHRVGCSMRDALFIAAIAFELVITAASIAFLVFENFGCFAFFLDAERDLLSSETKCNTPADLISAGWSRP